ncbi:hypothetical protein ACJX0J_026869, partial [Zea mays]
KLQSGNIQIKACTFLFPILTCLGVSLLVMAFLYIRRKMKHFLLLIKFVWFDRFILIVLISNQYGIKSFGSVQTRIDDEFSIARVQEVENIESTDTLNILQTCFCLFTVVTNLFLFHMGQKEEAHIYY